MSVSWTTSGAKLMFAASASGTLLRPGAPLQLVTAGKAVGTHIPTITTPVHSGERRGRLPSVLSRSRAWSVWLLISAARDSSISAARALLRTLNLPTLFHPFTQVGPLLTRPG